MKNRYKMSLSLKLTSCFLAAIIVLSAFHLASYVRLLDTMTREAETSADERMTSAVTRLDESFAQIRGNYLSLSYTTPFRTANRSGNPSDYDMVDLWRQAELYLSSNNYVYAFAIFFNNIDMVVTSSGTYPDAKYFSSMYACDTYTPEFWRQEKTASFARRFYPAATFYHVSPIPTMYDKVFLPVAFKPYWNSNVMTLLFLDIDALCEDADLYLTDNFYIFSGDGQLLYSSQADPELLTLPEDGGEFVMSDDGGYQARRLSADGEYVYVKKLPRNAVVGQIYNNLYISIAMVLAALIVGIAIVLVAIWHLLNPVKNILKLIPGDAESHSGQGGELKYIQTSVENMLSQREHYIQQISKKDAELSRFLLQSQLKNIYVEMDVSDNAPAAEDRVFFILYFRIHYRSGMLETIPAEPSAISHLFLNNLQYALQQFFPTSLVFQLEVNQFVAKVSLPADKPDITEPMQQLLQRLDNEREFAFFTVVQSGALSVDSDFNSVYDQVLNAAQYTMVQEQTQLIRLPLETDTVSTFFFPTELERQLRTLVRDGKAKEASELAAQILQKNISAGIRRIHMILLGSAIINATLRAISNLYTENGMFSLNGGNAYNDLPKCDTVQDYLDLICGFVHSAALRVEAREDVEEPILAGVQTFLENNYQRDFSMDEMAEALHLSKSYLSTYFKSKTGINLSDHIQCFRIHKAVEFLADPKLHIGDIGDMVGISNSSTFLRQFKKYTGITPREYRSREYTLQ